MGQQQVLADDGPLAGRLDLTVEEVDGEWPETQIWHDGLERHEYRLVPDERAMGPREALPIYRHVRPLPPDEAA